MCILKRVFWRLAVFQNNDCNICLLVAQCLAFFEKLINEWNVWKRFSSVSQTWLSNDLTALFDLTAKHYVGEYKKNIQKEGGGGEEEEEEVEEIVVAVVSDNVS